ncbi:MAG TPA: L,D-transpeptidase family protein [Pseudorhodoplanes sp.]|nr:L,D-transpeptidase family protein [Pseudorhodoplanes sp.]
MKSSHYSLFCTGVLALILLGGTAHAQFQPRPYAYPPAGRYMPMPDDGIVALDPDDDEEVAVVPQGPGQARRQAGTLPYDPRADDDPDAYRPDPSVDDPRAPEAAPYRDPAYSGPGARGADDAPRPPAPIDAARGNTPKPPANIAALPPDDQPETGEPRELPPQFKRQVVDYLTKEPAGTIVIDTPATYLYYVLGDGKAIRYGIGVGREGFTWSGVERISRLAEWPDWYPPAEMIERQPYLPRFMAGGPGNPLGARALYLGKTVYRIHGTNQPSTIGKFVSSGCIRMLNEDVEDLYNRVKVGTKVVVKPGGAAATASAGGAAPTTR